MKQPEKFSIVDINSLKFNPKQDEIEEKLQLSYTSCQHILPTEQFEDIKNYYNENGELVVCLKDNCNKFIDWYFNGTYQGNVKNLVVLNPIQQQGICLGIGCSFEFPVVQYANKEFGFCEPCQQKYQLLVKFQKENSLEFKCDECGKILICRYRLNEHIKIQHVDIFIEEQIQKRIRLTGTLSQLSTNNQSFLTQIQVK